MGTAERNWSVSILKSCAQDTHHWQRQAEQAAVQVVLLGRVLPASQRMFVRSGQYADNTPVAPASLQQTAAAWEPSVQQMVREIGGLEMAALEEAVTKRWPFKFRVNKVWKAMDAISDKGLHSYLQHHWVIIKLAPVQPSHANSPSQHWDSISHSADSSEQRTASELPGKSPCSSSEGSGMGTGQPGTNQLPDNSMSGASEDDRLAEAATGQAVTFGGAGDAASVTAAAALPHKRSHDEIEQGINAETSGDRERSSVPQSTQERLRASRGGGDEGQAARETEGACASTEAGTGAAAFKGDLSSVPAEDVSAVSAAVKEAGLQLADQGKAWFMRIDRFDKADKWFACPSFEMALLSDQARDRHFAPTSEVALEVMEGSPPVLLEFLVPLLVRLSAIKYSVFAKGFHCQWHAKVVTKVAASVAYFVDPCTIADDQRSKVSAIVTDGKEQARYNSMAAKFASPEAAGSSYARNFPEAPFLKLTFQDVKAIAAANPGRVPKGLAARPWPDIFLIYKATRGGRK